MSPLPTWLDADAKASEKIAPIVGGRPSEVAVMETLTANLHFLFAAFYKPDIKGRHKIIIESKAFPSDHVSSIYSFYIIPNRWIVRRRIPNLPPWPIPRKLNGNH
jgi:kynureninase